MKGNIFLLTVILLISFGNIIAQNMRLTNASTTEVNGIYVNMGINGNSDGVDYYQKENIYLYRYNNSSWIVGNDLGNNNLHYIYYYYEYSSGTYVTPDWLYLLTAGSLGSGSYPNVPFVANTAALPVELTTFNAKVTENNVELSWETATEVNNYGFEIERKVEDNEWNKLGFVEGHGNSNSPKLYSFTDSKFDVAGKYFYRLKQVDIDGTFEYSDVVDANLDAPNEFELDQNFPNPFNPATSIQFNLPKDSQVKLSVFNVLGEEVAKLLNNKITAGYHSVHFDASHLNSGLYLYSIQTDDFSSVKKMMLMK